MFQRGQYCPQVLNIAEPLGAPKQWCLTNVKNIESFQNWKQNLQFTLSLNPNLASFLTEQCRGDKKTKFASLRGFTDDTDSVLLPRRKIVQQKVNTLELMPGQFANYCPVLSRNTIVRNSTSIQSIWQAIRFHNGFQSSGSHFLDLAEIHLYPDERPEDLGRRTESVSSFSLIGSLLWDISRLIVRRLFSTNETMQRN